MGRLFLVLLVWSAIAFACLFFGLRLLFPPTVAKQPPPRDDTQAIETVQDNQREILEIIRTLKTQQETPHTCSTPCATSSRQSIAYTTNSYSVRPFECPYASCQSPTDLNFAARAMAYLQHGDEVQAARTVSKIENEAFRAHVIMGHVIWGIRTSQGALALYQTVTRLPDPNAKAAVAGLLMSMEITAEAEEALKSSAMTWKERRGEVELVPEIPTAPVDGSDIPQPSQMPTVAPPIEHTMEFPPSDPLPAIKDPIVVAPAEDNLVPIPVETANPPQESYHPSAGDTHDGRLSTRIPSSQPAQDENNMLADIGGGFLVFFGGLVTIAVTPVLQAVGKTVLLPWIGKTCPVLLTNTEIS